MKVICKSTKDHVGLNRDSDELFWQGSLTIGKEYEVLQIIDLEYVMMNDYGFEHLYPVKCFITKQELREEKLKELGI
jgi:hypothetical protein